MRATAHVVEPRPVGEEDDHDHDLGEASISDNGLAPEARRSRKASTAT
jgi:hypothetical protein